MSEKPYNSINKKQKKHKKTKKLQLAGEGAHGCVFRPSLNCYPDTFIPAKHRQKNQTKNQTKNIQNVKNVENANKAYVSKIFANEKGALKERKHFEKYVHKINADAIFTTHMIGSCQANTRPLNNNSYNTFKKCDHSKPQRTPTLEKKNRQTQLIIEDGGMDLYEQAKYIPFIEMVKHMRPLFIGLVQMEKKKIAHADVKIENITYNSYTKRMFYIDFGLMTSFDYMFDVRREHYLNHVYYTNPPEHLMASYIYSNIRLKTDNPFSLTRRQSLELYRHPENFKMAYRTTEYAIDYFGDPNDIPPILSEIIYVFRDSIRKQAPRMLLEWENIWKQEYEKKEFNMVGSIERKNAKNDTVRRILRKYANKMDVYGLGSSIFALLELSLYYSLHPAKKDKNPEDKVMWFENRAFYNKLGKLIIDMMKPNPSDRLTPSQALKRYDQIMTSSNI